MGKKERRIMIGEGLEGLQEIFKEILTDIVDSNVNRPEKEPVGKISESLRQKYLTWAHDKEDIDAEIEFTVEQMKKKMARDIEEIFSKRHEMIVARKEELWDSIREEVGATEDDSLNINPKTGLISKWLDDDYEHGIQ